MKAHLFLVCVLFCAESSIASDNKYAAHTLPDFGNKTQTHNADPENNSILTHTPLVVDYLGKKVQLTHGATKSAIMLIDYFSQSMVDQFKEKRVLELGSGTGLAGIAANMMGAKVDFTDQSVVMELLEKNVTNNLNTDQLARSRFKELQWHNSFSDHPLIDVHYDYIIAADVVYAKEAIQPLVNTLNTFSRRDTVIYLSYIQRFPWTHDFFDQMNKQFVRTLVQYKEGIWVFKFTKI